MFTGIVTDIGEILELERGAGLRARIATSYDVAGIAIGASIACDGACLTAVATGGEPRPWFEAEVSGETASATTIGRGGWRAGGRVNLERPLRVGDELGGHVVLGHVDGVAEVLSARPDGESVRVRLRVPDALARFVAPKGSIALNGTSLTVNEVDGAEFGVNLVPHTLSATTWRDAAAGGLANVEVDMMARYAARLRDFDAPARDGAG